MLYFSRVFPVCGNYQCPVMYLLKNILYCNSTNPLSQYPYTQEQELNPTRISLGYVQTENKYRGFQGTHKAQATFMRVTAVKFLLFRCPELDYYVIYLVFRGVCWCRPDSNTVFRSITVLVTIPSPFFIFQSELFSIFSEIRLKFQLIIIILMQWFFSQLILQLIHTGVNYLMPMKLFTKHCVQTH